MNKCENARNLSRIIYVYFSRNCTADVRHLAEMIQQPNSHKTCNTQGELAIRIDENVDDTLSNVTGAQVGDWGADGWYRWPGESLVTLEGRLVMGLEIEHMQPNIAQHPSSEVHPMCTAFCLHSAGPIDEVPQHRFLQQVWGRWQHAAFSGACLSSQPSHPFDIARFAPVHPQSCLPPLPAGCSFSRCLECSWPS